MNFRESCEHRTSIGTFCGNLLNATIWVRSPHTGTVIDFWVCARHKKDQISLLEERGFVLVKGPRRN